MNSGYRLLEQANIQGGYISERTPHIVAEK
jgi:hypothetical protein